MGESDFVKRKSYSWQFWEKIWKLFDLQSGIISSIRRAPFYNDEPKLFNYVASLKDSSNFTDGCGADKFASGTSFDQKRAFVGAVGESIERYCLSVYKEADFIKASYRKIKEEALDPASVVSFCPSQLKQSKFRNCVFSEKTKFKWVRGYSLSRRKEVFVPSQLVFVPYRFKKEKVIRFPITTGAACGRSLEEAIYRGMCEVVERDSFIIYYLNRLAGRMVDIFTIQELKRIFEYFQKYNLDFYLVDVTTDLGIPAIVSFLIDKSGLGPAVSLGAASGVSSFEAAIKAAEEAQHSRPWIRREMEKGNKNRNSSSIVGRGLYWSEKKMIEKMDFWMKGEKILVRRPRETLSFKKKLRIILGKLKKLNLEVVYVDVTLPKIKRIGFRVVKVIIPQLQPLYLEEERPYLGGRRLYEVPVKLGFSRRKIKELNSIPHPFL